MRIALHDVLSQSCPRSCGGEGVCKYHKDCLGCRTCAGVAVPRLTSDEHLRQGQTFGMAFCHTFLTGVFAVRVGADGKTKSASRLKNTKRVKSAPSKGKGL